MALMPPPRTVASPRRSQRTATAADSSSANPAFVAKLKERAVRQGRSAEEEHRAILREVLLGPAAQQGEITFESYLQTMPNVGEDEDFSRIEGSMREIDLSD